MKTLLITTSICNVHTQFIIIITILCFLLLFKSVINAKNILYNLIIFFILLLIGSKQSTPFLFISTNFNIYQTNFIIFLSLWVLLFNHSFVKLNIKLQNIEAYLLLLILGMTFSNVSCDFISLLIVIEFIGIVIVGILLITTNANLANSALILIWINALSAFLFLLGYMSSVTMLSQNIHQHVIQGNVISQLLIIFGFFLKLGLLPIGYWLVYFYNYLSKSQIILYLAILYPLNLILFSKLLCLITFKSAIITTTLTFNLLLALPFLILLIKDSTLSSVLVASSCSTAIIILTTTLF